MIDYDKKSTVRTVRKVCAKCGEKGWFRERETRCKRRRFGRGSYCCWGELTRVRKPKPPLAHPAGWYLNAENQEVTVEGQRVRANAEKMLALARKQVSMKTRAMARLATSLRFWEKRASYYAKRASVTDAELQAEHVMRTARAAARPRRRGIAVGGTL